MGGVDNDSAAGAAAEGVSDGVLGTGMVVDWVGMGG